MKLYLKINRPDGKRFNYMDPVTRMFNYKKVVFLYPEKATEVEKEFADQLLERDPHLVSKESYSKKDDPQVIRLAEIAKERKANEHKYNPETTEQRQAANLRFKRSSNKAVQPPVDKGLNLSGEEEALVGQVIKDLGEDPMQYVELLAQVSELNRETITIDAIRHFGKLLNCTFSKKKGRGKEAHLKQLDDRCDELTKKIEKYMNTGPEKYMAAVTETGTPANGPADSSSLPETLEEAIIAEETVDDEAELIEAGLEEETK